MTKNLRNTAIQSLQLQPEFRTKQDIAAIYHMTKHINFFKQILKDDGKLHKACCKVMAFEDFEAGDKIFNYGEAGDKFYIIISGELSVFVPELNENNEFLINFSHEVAVLSDGSYFGELALLRGGNRAATIVAKRKTLLAVLKKSDFNKKLSEFTENAINEKVNFLKKIPMFSFISVLELQKLSYYFTEINVVKGQIVFKENSKADKVYFVKRGEFKLTKSESLQPGNAFLCTHDRSFHFSNRIIKRNKAGDLQIVIKAGNEVLGYEEMLEKSNVYKTSCTCISAVATLYQISYSNFCQRMKYPQTWRVLDEKLTVEKDIYRERIKNLQSVEDYKHEFSSNKPSHFGISHSNKAIVLKKFSPMRDILKSPFSTSVDATKSFMTNSVLNSLDSRSGLSRNTKISVKNVAESMKFSLSKPLFRQPNINY